MRRKLSQTILILALISLWFFPSKLCADSLVKLRPEDSLESTLKISSLPKGWRYLPAVDLYIVESDGEDRLKQLQTNGDVVAVEDESEITLQVLPNDPYLEDQKWASEGLNDIGVAKAWDMTTGSRDVVVAIIDTGISMGHPDLVDNLWINKDEIPDNGLDDDHNGYVDDVHGYNFWEKSPDPVDENNHGSHMAGVIGAVGNNGLGVGGVNWEVSLMPLRFTSADGTGNSILAVQAIDYAIQNGARIINASWTLNLPEGPSDPKDLVRQALEKAEEAGVLFVTAAGNQFQGLGGIDIDETPVYPASFDLSNMLTVAAVDGHGELASFSNYGPESVDLTAPGYGIVSTNKEDGLIAMSGTSVATAVVSGAAALILSERPQLKAFQLASLIRETVTKNENLESVVQSGGLLNLYGAMTGSPLEEKNTTDKSASLSESTTGGCSLVRQ